MSKPKVAFYWCASCGGCEEAVVDLGEKILDVVAQVDIVFWPVALDFKEKDVAAMADGSIAVAFLNGAVRTSEQKHMSELLRRKARIVVGFGSCAQTGGIPGLANLTTRERILNTVYGGGAPEGTCCLNGCELRLPELFERVYPLGQVIPVDYYVPGCPPTPKMLAEALGQLLSGDLPVQGSVLADDRAMCEICPRRDTRPEKLMLKEFRRPHEVVADPEQCLLAQGLVCLGLVTRAGCDALCIKGNTPCTGCNGPTSRVRDFGGKAVSAIASLAGSNDEGEIERILSGIPDPMVAFYRYSLPAAYVPVRRKP